MASRITLGEQSDPGFLPLAYGIALPEEPLGHADSPVREAFLLQLRRGLLSVSDDDLMALVRRP